MDVRHIDRRTQRRRILTLLLAIAVALLAALVTHARAQGIELPDPTTWFLSTAAWGVVTSFLVSTIRANFLKDLKGFGAIALTFGVSILGSLVASTGVLGFAGILLEVESLADAFLFGIVAGGIAMGWYDGTGAIAAKVGQVIASANAATLALATSASASRAADAVHAVNLAASAAPTSTSTLAAVNPDSVMDFILSLVRSRFGGMERVPAFVWGIVETLAREFAGQALTPDLRRAIQRRLLDLLAASGAPGRDV